MMVRFTPGLRVRFVRRCVLSNCVPKNSQGYTHMALRSEGGDLYEGAGIIEKGTVASVLGHAVHGMDNRRDNPILNLNGICVCVHSSNIEMI